MKRKMTILLLLQLFMLSAHASQLVRLVVDQKADIYEIQVEMMVDAPAENIRAILTDYANLDRLNESITSSRIIDGEHGGAVRVLTRIENCILFFCKILQKVEDVTEDDHGRILVSLVPNSSNFRSGEATWELQDSGDSTRVIHHARLEPDLWIPPWIGTAILKDTLRREIIESFETLDCLARKQCVKQSEKPLADNRTDLAYEM
jgi:hypothetical protein